MNYNEEYEQEINLKNLIFYALYRWRVIMAVGIVCAVLAGGYKLAGGIRSMGNQTEVQEAMEQYEEDQDSYERQKALYEQDIALLQENLKQQNDYMENSVLMRINPYAAAAAHADIMIKTEDNRSLPNEDKNVDPADSLVKVYGEAASSMINWEKMAQEMQTDPAYLRELLFVDMDYDSNSISLNVYHEDEAVADQILGEILGQLEAFSASENGHLDKHSITIVNRNTSQHVNITNASDKGKSSLLDVQKAVRDSITAAQKTLTDRQKLLKDLNEPSKPASSSMKSILKSGIKFGIIGLVLGICLAGFCYCLIFVLDSKVYSAEDMKDQFGLQILGTLPMAEKTGLFSFIDKILERIEGTSYRPAENLVYERAAVNLKNYVEGSNSDTTAEASVGKKILVTGTCSTESSAAVAAKLDSFLKEDQSNRIELITGGDLCDDTEALRKLASCDGMILVEQRGQSRFNAIRNEIELASSLKKSVYGCIIL
jgi:hypothetical protein